MAKRKNPQDATRRNVQASMKRDRSLSARLRTLENTVAKLSMLLRVKV